MIGFVAREKRPRWLNIVVPLASVVLAMIVGGIVLAATGHNPLTTYRRSSRPASPSRARSAPRWSA